jgi:hypothetical protein
MFNMGFQGNFGGGFIGNPGSAPTPAGGVGVTYAISYNRSRPKDRSGRKSPYEVVSSPHSGMNLHRRSK